MRLEQAVYPDPIPTQQMFWGQLKANGDPRRRTWRADVTWRFWGGKINGSATYREPTLTGLLEQLVRHESIMPADTIGFQPEILLQYHPDLRQSIRQTVRRYLSDLEESGKIFVSNYPYPD